MNLLGSLLPGVRSIRAPFSAGAITVLAIWLAEEPKDPCGGWAKHVCQSFVALDDTVSTFAISGIAAFATYLLGALITTLTDAVVRLPLAAGWFRPLQPWLREAVRKVDGYDRALAARGGELCERYLDLRRPLPTPTPPRILAWLRRASIESLSGLRHPSVAAARALVYRRIRLVKRWLSATRTVQREWRQTHFRLLVERPALFGELDRLEAEGEFRFAIALPLFVLGIVLTDRLDSWWMATGTAAVVTILVLGGMESTKRAENALSDLVLHGLVELPFITAVKRELGITEPQPAAAASAAPRVES